MWTDYFRQKVTSCHFHRRSMVSAKSGTNLDAAFKGCKLKKQQNYIKDFQQEQSESDNLEFEFHASIKLIN